MVQTIKQMSTAIKHIKTEKQLVPVLRFKEFDGDWNNEAVGNHFDLMSGFAFKSEDISEDSTGVPILRGINITEGYIRHSEKIDRYFLGDTSKLERLRVKVGDLVLGMDGSKVGKNSALVTEKDADSLLIQRVARLREKKDSCLSFVYSHINSIRFHKYVDVVNTSSGIPHISSKQINDFKIYFPKSLPEQQKIASFLSAVDEKIQQLTKKKELLEQYKKGVMQQLFSGQLRFKDENGKDYPDWEEKRLDAMISKFVVPMRDKPKELKGEIPWCRIEDFNGKYLSSSKSGQGVSVETVKEMNLKVYPIGTLLVSCSANLGFCAITEVELITNQTFIGLVPDNKKADVLYLLYVMRMMARQLNTLSSGTTISYLSRQQFEKFKVPYPSLKEQQKIATYLSSIDTKIESVTNQITQTQTFKKGLLQQMFV